MRDIVTPPADVDQELRRVIGLRSAVLFVVGSVIGSGIFLTTGAMAAVIPSASLLIAAWASGGLLALAGGLTYAEMGAMFPRSGGVYVFLKEAYGALPAFLYGWAALFVVLSGGIAAVAVGFATYLAYFLPALTTTAVAGLNGTKLVAAVMILVLGAINYTGARSGNFVNVVTTAAKIGALAVLPVMAIVASRVHPVFLPVVPSTLARPAASFGVAMIAVLWTYEGWYFVTYAAGEIKEPQRTLPRALLFGVLLLTTIYVVVNIAYLYALTIGEMQGVTRIAERAATALVGPAGATFVALTVVVSTFGNNAAAILAGSRLLFAMASDRVFIPAASRVHPRYHTPHVAIAALTAWSSLLALSGTYEQLFTYVMFASILFNVAAGIALFRLRRTMPERPRPYRTWGYPIVPLLFITASIGFVVNTLIERPVESLAGVGLLALGLPAYWYWGRKVPATVRGRVAR
jgi:APA family basic amino acid/polyamine antiporter